MKIAINWKRSRTLIAGHLPVLLIAGYLSALTISLSPVNVYGQAQSPTAPENNQNNIEFSADLFTSRVEDEVRVTTLTTNVVVTQGAMEILGDAAILLESMTSNQLEKVTVLGHPANFKHISAETGELTEGHSDSIVFETGNRNNVRVITLTGNVTITQQASELFGDNAELLENTVSSEIDTITLLGKPARYQHLAASTAVATEGQGDSIFYSLINETVIEFAGNAEFTQPNTFVSCATVTYYPDDGERITTIGPCRAVRSSPDQ